MAEQATVLVVGATGSQGGSVAHHLLRSGQFQVRCLTRNPASQKAVALRAAGAQTVAGDLDDPGSLRLAMLGCWGVFGVTNYWEHFDKEYRLGKNLVDMVANSGVEYFVFSTLPYAKKVTVGKLPVPHFDMKGELEEYARNRQIPATFVHIAYYYENFLTFFPPRQQPDGSFAFGFPQGDTPLAGVCVEDVGGVICPIFQNPNQFRDQVIGVVGDDLTPDEYAAVMSRVLGVRINYNYVLREAFASQAFPGAEDLANMFEFNRLYIPNRTADLTLSRRLYPQIQNFETWMQTHKPQFQKLLNLP